MYFGKHIVMYISVINCNAKPMRATHFCKQDFFGHLRLWDQVRLSQKVSGTEIKSPWWGTEKNWTDVSIDISSAMDKSRRNHCQLSVPPPGSSKRFNGPRQDIFCSFRYMELLYIMSVFMSLRALCLEWYDKLIITGIGSGGFIAFYTLVALPQSNLWVMGWG